MHTVDGRLTAQLLEHLCCSCESIARLADGDVKNEFLDAKLAHGVAALVLSAATLRLFSCLLSRTLTFRLFDVISNG